MKLNDAAFRLAICKTQQQVVNQRRKQKDEPGELEQTVSGQIQPKVEETHIRMQMNGTRKVSRWKDHSHKK
jgi:hypothetical protein